MKRLLPTLAMGVVLSSVIVFSIRADEDSGTNCPQVSGSTNRDDGKKPCGLAIELDLDLDGKSAADKDKSQRGCSEELRANLCTEDSIATKCATGTDKCCAEVTDADHVCADAKTPCRVAETAKPAHRRKVSDGEAAKVLIEILDRLGPSALEGTAFDVEACSANDTAKRGGRSRSIRRELVEYVNQLEAEDACVDTPCVDCREEAPAAPIARDFVVDLPCPPCPVMPYATCPYPAPPAPSGFSAPNVALYGAGPPVFSGPMYGAPAPKSAAVEVLREAAETLERTAAELERHNLYDSSDLTREMAGHLRLEGRRLQRHECEAAEDQAEVQTTGHQGAAGQAPRPKGARQAWHLGGVRVSK